MKEFWQTGRSHDSKVSTPNYPANIWPTDTVPLFEETIDELYNKMESLSLKLLSRCCTFCCPCSLYLGKEENWLGEMTENGNTIMRIIHYPPLGDNVTPGAVRSAAHEDINFITLLVTATADGLEVMDHDGKLD